MIAHGVPDLITNSLDEYETLARRLAEEPEALADMRRKARANRQTSSLFDTARFAKSLESAYHRMWETHLSGRKPHHIEVTEDQEEDKPTIRLGASTAEAPPRDPATADSVELLTLANKHHQAGRFAEAEEMYRRILKAQPESAEALHFLGLIAYQRGRNKEAIELIDRAIAIVPGNAYFIANLGLIYNESGKYDEALRCSRRAVEIDPEEANGHFNMGKALEDLWRPDEAIESYRHAISLRPEFVGAHVNLRKLYYRRGETEAAIEACRHALEIDPDLVAALGNLGNALRSAGMLGEAVASYRRAIAIDPKSADAYYNLAITLKDEKSLEEAIESGRRAVAIDPDHRGAAGILVNYLYETCCWDEARALAPIVDRQNAAAIAAGEPTGETPLSHLCRSMNQQANLAVARSWSVNATRRAGGSSDDFRHSTAKAAGERITVGYLSSDFMDHPVAHLIEDVIAWHNRHAFQINTYSSGSDGENPYRERIARHCDSFVDIRGLGHGDAAKRIRDDGVDILIDLNGHTKGARPEIAALRPAPVQAVFLGFPGTSGADYFDYILTDRTVTPEESIDQYTEPCLSG